MANGRKNKMHTAHFHTFDISFVYDVPMLIPVRLGLRTGEINVLGGRELGNGMWTVKLGVIPCMVKTWCIGVWAAIKNTIIVFRKISEP